MGTANALEALLTRARALGLSVHLTDPFYDIDVEGDLTRLAAELRLAPARAPRTAGWLEQWGQAVAQFRDWTGEPGSSPPPPGLLGPAPFFRGRRRPSSPKTLSMAQT